MERTKQIAVQAPNKSGVMAKICQAMAWHEVNIIAIMAPESLGTGILRIVPDDLEKAEDVFNELQFSFTVEEVLSLRLTNKPGELAQIASTLAKSNIGIEFLYATTDGFGRAERVILSPTNLDEAEEALKGLAV